MNIALNMDCMEYMSTLEDNAFSLAIVDPPYGISSINTEPWKKTITNPRGVKMRNLMRNRISQGSGKNKNRAIQAMNSDFDFSPPKEDYFKELFRVSKNQIIFGGNYFPLPPTRCIICWDKKQPWENFSQFELAWTSFKRPALMFRYRNTGGDGRKPKIHPTQKPVSLYEFIIQKFCKPGDTILDTHLGSGSSRIAAYKLGFDFVGTEINEQFFNDQEQRFNQFISL